MLESAPRKASGLVLWLGFGGLLVCILGAATGSLVVMDRVHQDETHIRKAFVARLDALDQIRSQILLSGTYVRDVLLSPDPSGAAAEVARLAALKRDSGVALTTYSHSLEAEEREPFLALRSEIEAYWKILDQTMSWTPEERNRLRDSFFYDELIPRRNAMLQIADRIAIANEHGLNSAEEQITGFVGRPAPVVDRHFRHHPGGRPAAGAPHGHPHLAVGARTGAAPGGKHARSCRPAGTFRQAAARPGE